MIYVDKDFEKYWSGKNPFNEVDLLEGEVFRKIKTRRTLRFEIEGKSYFAKIHHGVGWREIFKNLMMLKKPVVSARNEYQAIRSLERLGVDTMKVAAYGERGTNPANIDSFIITHELKNTVSLEDFCKNWKSCPPSFSLKKALIEHLARTSRKLHRNGINHRDYYICHFLLELPEGTGKIDIENLTISLIDLHRSQIRKKTPLRWIIKDVGGLWFSAMDAGLTNRDLFRFMRKYSDKPLRTLLQEESNFWKRVDENAKKLYVKEFGHDAD